MPNFTTLISELTEEQQQTIKNWSKILPSILREFESRLQGYVVGNETSIKLLGDMNILCRFIGDARDDLIKNHKLPTHPENELELMNKLREVACDLRDDIISAQCSAEVEQSTEIAAKLLKAAGTKMQTLLRLIAQMGKE